MPCSLVQPADQLLFCTASWAGRLVKDGGLARERGSFCKRGLSGQFCSHGPKLSAGHACRSLPTPLQPMLPGLGIGHETCGWLSSWRLGAPGLVT